MQAREKKITTLGQKMDVGTYGGEVVRYLVEQIHSELTWIRRLQRLGANSKSSRGKIARRKSMTFIPNLELLPWYAAAAYWTISALRLKRPRSRKAIAVDYYTLVS